MAQTETDPWKRVLYTKADRVLDWVVFGMLAATGVLFIVALVISLPRCEGISLVECWDIRIR